MSTTVTNLIQGPATLYIGAFGAAEPEDTAVATPPVSPAWKDCGGTSGGLTLSINQTYSQLSVDQIVDTPESRLTGRVITVATSLAEGTLTNLKTVLNGGTVTDDAVAHTQTYDPDIADSATQPDYAAIIFDGWAPALLRRRVVVRKVLSTAEVGIAYTKDGQTLFPVTFTAHYVDSTTPLFHVCDAVPAA